MSGIFFYHNFIKIKLSMHITLMLEICFFNRFGSPPSVGEMKGAKNYNHANKP